MRVPVLIAVAVALAGCGNNKAEDTVPIDTIIPANVTDLVGKDVTAGEEVLKERGYESTRTDGDTIFWWNGNRGSCVRVVSSGGRYQSADPVVPTDCSSTAGKSAAADDERPGPPVDLVDYVGARADRSQVELAKLGYRSARTAGQTSYWWNQGNSVCARIVTADGRFRIIETVEPADCNI